MHNYAPEDLAAAVSFLADCSDRYPFADLVQSRFRLDDAAAAFKSAISTRAPRVAVEPGPRS